MFPPILLRAAPLMILALSIWVTGYAAEKLAPRFGVASIHVAGWTPTVAISAIATARLMAITPHWRIIARHPFDALRITDGMSFSAGAIGGIIAIAYVAQRNGLSIFALLDLYSVVLPLGLATSSAGCLLREDCFGRTAPPPFGIVFPGLATARYPVELYAAGAFLLLFALINGDRLRSLPHGVTTFASIASIGWITLALDRLRLQANSSFFSVDQVLVYFISTSATATAFIWWWRSRRANNDSLLHSCASPSQEKSPVLLNIER